MLLRVLAALGAGILFGLGLAVSQMVNPAKVLAFLDILGDWDPSLAFVMGGAVAVTFVGYRWALSRERPLLETRYRVPEPTPIDRNLIAGAVVFGIGWGLVGFCPGPALAALAFGVPDALVFLAAMIAGAALYHGPGRRLSARSE